MTRLSLIFIPVIIIQGEEGLKDVFACTSDVYCQGPLLDTVQRARLFPDSKTFVDMSLNAEPDVVLKEFSALYNTSMQLTKSQIRAFVKCYFSGPGHEFEPWTPTDYNNNAVFLSNLKDPLMRDFGWDLCRIWKDLGRKIKVDVQKNPSRYSLFYLPNPFVIPGGRFRETYYWDSYWIIRGLLTCNMKNTAKGMLENFIHYIKRYGYIPNGGRIYQSLRSQPPFFIPMVYDYFMRTNDTDFLRNASVYMETEYNFWIRNRSVTVSKDGREYTIQHYGTALNNPRPESYTEDMRTAQHTKDDLKAELYSNIASATETGMGFSSRWFSREDDSLNLNTTVTKKILPVDLNSMLCLNEQLLAKIFHVLGNEKKSTMYDEKSKIRKVSMEKIFWNDNRGIWQDFSLITNTSRDYFFPSNIFPLYAKCVNNEQIKTKRVLEYLENNGVLDYKGGVPASLIRTGEQWDFPNGWPPIQHVYVWTLAKSSDPLARSLGLQLAQKWLSSNWMGWNRTRVVFEKYSVATPGSRGGGGEYNVQEGFGWTNGVLLDIMEQFGNQLQLNDQQKNTGGSCNPTSNGGPTKHFSLYVHYIVIIIFMVHTIKSL